MERDDGNLSEKSKGRLENGMAGERRGKRILHVEYGSSCIWIGIFAKLLQSVLDQGAVFCRSKRLGIRE